MSKFKIKKIKTTVVGKIQYYIKLNNVTYLRK